MNAFSYPHIEKDKIRKENTLTGTGLINTACYKGKYKRFPSFGKQLKELRRLGRIPAQMIQVVFDWNIAKMWPRIVLADKDVSPERIDFSYLTNLPVQVTYTDKDAHRVNSVVEQILKVHPIFLSSFNLDCVGSGKCRLIILPLGEKIMEKAA